jgi:hypothetical protein
MQCSDFGNEIALRMLNIQKLRSTNLRIHHKMDVVLRGTVKTSLSKASD